MAKGDPFRIEERPDARGRMYPQTVVARGKYRGKTIAEVQRLCGCSRRWAMQCIAEGRDPAGPKKQRGRKPVLRPPEPEPEVARGFVGFADGVADVFHRGLACMARAALKANGEG